MIESLIQNHLATRDFIEHLAAAFGVRLELRSTGPVAINGQALPSDLRGILGERRADIIRYLEDERDAVEVFARELGVGRKQF